MEEAGAADVAVERMWLVCAWPEPGRSLKLFGASLSTWDAVALEHRSGNGVLPLPGSSAPQHRASSMPDSVGQHSCLSPSLKCISAPVFPLQCNKV